MTPGTEQNVTDDRETIDSNARRIVGIAALRRIHKAIGEGEEADRVLRNRVAPIAAIVMIAIAALIWIFGAARPERETAPAPPLPECAPPRQDITI